LRLAKGVKDIVSHLLTVESESIGLSITDKARDRAVEVQASLFPRAVFTWIELANSGKKENPQVSFQIVSDLASQGK
jgi:hypothetical protein